MLGNILGSILRGGRRGGGGGVRRRGSGFGISPRILMAGLMALFAVGTYFLGSRVEENPYTGEVQRISMTEKEEVALGLQAVPEMMGQFGGVIPPSEREGRRVEEIGKRLVAANVPRDTFYRFQFHLLADPKTVNAFALPGGQIFITKALYDQLPSDDALAGVLGHEIGHVVGRHSAEQMTKSKLVGGLTGAAVIGGGGEQGGQMAVLVGQMINTRYGREDESQSDEIGVAMMMNAGYDPRGLIRVMEVLKASGGGGGPEFLSTHPDPGNREEAIKGHIERFSREGAPRFGGR